MRINKSLLKQGRQDCIKCSKFIGNIPYYMRKIQRFLCSSCRMKKLSSDNKYMTRVMAEIGEDYM